MGRRELSRPALPGALPLIFKLILPHEILIELGKPAGRAAANGRDRESRGRGRYRGELAGVGDPGEAGETGGAEVDGEEGEEGDRADGAGQQAAERHQRPPPQLLHPRPLPKLPLFLAERDGRGREAVERFEVQAVINSPLLRSYCERDWLWE